MRTIDRSLDLRRPSPNVGTHLGACGVLGDLVLGRLEPDWCRGIFDITECSMEYGVSGALANFGV